MGNYIAVGSITVALIGLLFGYLERRSFDRRRRTLEFLLSIIEDDGPIHQASLELATWIANSRILKDDDVNPEEDKLIIKLLDFYDLVSDTAVRRVVDEEMIIMHLGGRMRSAYNMLKNYIQFRRDRLDRPGLYMPFETFVNDHIRDKKV